MELGETTPERFAKLDALGYKQVEYFFTQPPLEEDKKPSDTLLLCVCVNVPHKLIKAPNDKEG
jgi:hypothetical protein